MKKKVTSKTVDTDLSENEIRDSSGLAQVEGPPPVLWGKQTKLSLKYFNIGIHKFNSRFIDVLVIIKCACAQVNYQNKLISEEHQEAIQLACKEILSGKYYDQFPLSIWQTGSGTQTNMNVNEVLCSLANGVLKGRCQKPKYSVDKDVRNTIHPNDHVNLSQSSNDVFPTAMHIVVAQQATDTLLPALNLLNLVILQKRSEFEGTQMVGRTHLMDALPISVEVALSAYQSQLTTGGIAIQKSLESVYLLALGGTAVGSGENAPANFGPQTIAILAEHFQLPLKPHPNLYAAVSGDDALLCFSGALKQLAAVLLKIANDFRLLGSGPRCGINEWHLPANEPGSSIMPGKVNPTQCEALSMVCLQVFGNDLTISLAAANGQLQLNTNRPVIIHNLMESIDLLSDAMLSFAENCVRDMTLNHSQIAKNMHNNLSVVTLLTDTLGYDVAAKIVQKANEEHLALAEAAEALGLYSEAAFNALINEVTGT